VNSVERGDRQALRRKAALISLLIGFLMLVMKVGGYLITNSAAILSDAMESVVHVIATGVAFYSVILIARPADSRHPYGYGKAEYFSAGVEGALIVIAAIAICYEAVHDILLGSKLRSLDVGVIVTAAAGAINLALGAYLIRTGKRTNSLVLVADGKHVLTDSYTSIGVLIGLILVRITNITLLDPLFAIAVGLNIIVTGYKLVAESVRGLMNAVDPETLERTVSVLNHMRTSEMIDVHRLRAWRAGENRFIDFHLTLPFYMPLWRVHEVQDDVVTAIRAEFDDHAEVLLHLDACNSDCCVFCPNDDCDRRSEPKTITQEFTLERAQGEPAHRVLHSANGNYNPEQN
jgi:cation diffusion facilitator family transporter